MTTLDQIFSESINVDGNFRDLELSDIKFPLKISEPSGMYLVDSDGKLVAMGTPSFIAQLNEGLEKIQVQKIFGQVFLDEIPVFHSIKPEYIEELNNQLFSKGINSSLKPIEKDTDLHDRNLCYYKLKNEQITLCKGLIIRYDAGNAKVEFNRKLFDAKIRICRIAMNSVRTSEQEHIFQGVYNRFYK